MADTDDIREGKSFGVGTPQARVDFPLKGMDHMGWGLKNRMSRIFDATTQRTVMLAFDHGFLMGPTSGLERIDLNIVPLMDYADCMMCTRGILRTVLPAQCPKPVCLRADAGTTILTHLNDNIVMDVQEAVRLNASAMAVMVAVGCKETEAITIRNLHNTVDAGMAHGMPVMGVTAVGKDMVRDARYFAMASRVCVENGASIVKTYYTEGFEKVTSCCSVPVVIAGGKKLPELEALQLAHNAIQAGASGVDMGRNVFQSEDPVAMIQAVHGVVHDGLKPEQALEKFNDLKK